MKDFFDYLANNGLTPNGFYVLWGIANKSRPLVINVHTELRLLSDLGFIEDAKKGILTEKGTFIISNAETMFGNMKLEVKQPIASTDDETNMQKYVEFFPKGKLPSGKAARVPKPDIKNAFDWFFKTYEYSWDTVLKATAYYVDTYEAAGYLYMKNSQYFIRKQITGKTFDSDLAAYCEIILNGGHDDEGNFIKEKVV
jgi:hypothetical protein